MTAVLQGKRSNYDTDLFMPLIEARRARWPGGNTRPATKATSRSGSSPTTSGRSPSSSATASSPANDGRGYVLRRLIRRAFRQGNLIGIDKPFLFELVGRVADIMKDAYPELLASVEYISKVCLAEEERFAFTLVLGPALSSTRSSARPGSGAARSCPATRSSSSTTPSAFRSTCRRSWPGRRACPSTRPASPGSSRSRRSGPGCPGRARPRRKEKQVYEEFKDLKVRSRVHETGRDWRTPRVIGLLKDGRRAEVLRAGEAGEVILEETPFYAEAGGQVGDTGSLKGARFSGPRRTASPTPPPRSSPTASRSSPARSARATGSTPRADLVRRQADLEQPHGDPPPPRRPAAGPRRPRQAGRLARLAGAAALRFHPFRGPDARGDPAGRGDRQREGPGRHRRSRRA